jgi:hypothetical protein
MLLLLLGMVTALFAARIASWQTRPVQGEQLPPAMATEAPAVETRSCPDANSVCSCASTSVLLRL